MLKLVIDTATERSMAALLKGDEVLFHLQLPFGIMNSQHLLPEIERGMQEAGYHWSQLELIGVGKGPGSYTGIRMGAMVAKSLSFAHAIPLVGICSLDGFVSHRSETYAVVIDAKLGGVYIRPYPEQPGRYSQEEAVELLGKYPVLVTPNAAVLKERFRFQQYWTWEEASPSPKRLAWLAEEEFVQGRYSCQGRLELLYISASAKPKAEIERA